VRVLVLTNNQPNQVALLNRLAKTVDVAGVVFSANVPRRRPRASKRLRQFVNGMAGRTAGRELVDSWFSMQRRYADKFPELPPAEVVTVDNVNDPATLDAIDRLEPDVVVVSGTNLVGRAVIEAAQRRRGIVNLHTGISPYVRGGPNCTNWCLALRWFHLIGNTVMWLDSGIDSGNIIATEPTPLTGDETLQGLHIAVMDHAHELYVEAVRRIATGSNVRSVKQKDVAEGAYFESADWTAGRMRSALRNFRESYKEFFEDEQQRRARMSELVLFPLHDA
jgi:methionyl-tRNA formyltransferase